MDSINDILSSLTPDDIEAVKSMAESLFSSANENDSRKEQSDSGDFDFGSFITPDMIFKISSLMNMMNSQKNEKYRLLEALKPNLSARRQKKADEAMQIMKILEILPLIAELNKSGDNDAKL